MHSRIFQMEKAPVDLAEYMVEEDIENSGFFNTIADYIDCDTDRIDDISWLVKHLSSFDEIIYDKLEDSIIFKEGFKQKYFAKPYKKLVDTIAETTLEEFSGNNTMKLFIMQNAIENKYGFYVYDEGNGCVTFDYFVRNLTENTKYYIGATIDYHS